MSPRKMRAVPKTFGACADRLFDLRTEKQALKKEVAKIEEEEKAVKNHLIETLPKSEASGVMGKKAKVSIGSKPVPTVKDWDKFYKFVLKTKDFSLMQRRVSSASINERWEDNKKVPGVEPFNVVTVSVTKI